ncbi:FMN-binding protein [Rhabdochromatium marinum]|uniref:FMN-binding protein n=1 Tax=Rhabdochromatium marinum TaxID=48729 RepID=UPI00190619C5|nr:FMN-binding protein [Rhabdochromatium marinum]
MIGRPRAVWLWRRWLATVVLAAALIGFGLQATERREDPRPRIHLADPAHQAPCLLDAREGSGCDTGFIAAHGMTEDPTWRGDGYGLLGQSLPAPAPFGLAVDARNDPVLSDAAGAALLARAHAHEPDAYRLELRPGAQLIVVERRDLQGRYRGLYLDNVALESSVRGFAGPIKLGVYLDEQGRIRRLVHLDSRETPSYLRQVEAAGFYAHFSGLPVDRAEHRVDAVSGATLTSRALAAGLTELVAAAEEPLGDYLAAPPRSFAVVARLSRDWIGHALLLLGLFVLAWQRRWPLSGADWRLHGLLAIGVLGLMLNDAFTYITLMQPFFGVTLSAFATLYLVLVLLGAIWDDNTYCQHICPFGQAQRLVARWDRGSRLSRWPLSHRRMRQLRQLLTLVLIVGILAGFERWRGFELFPDLFGFDSGSLWFLLALFLILRVSAWIPMLWCRLLCPTGEVLDTLARLMRPHSVRIKTCNEQ